MRASIYLAISLFLTSGLAAAEQIFKYTDEEGNVTYSQEVPPGARDVEAIKLQPGPSPSAQQAAQERQRQMEAASEKPAAEGPPGQTKKPRVDAAKADLEAAERRLDEAKQVGPGDRQGTAGGASRFTDSYRQRVEAAEAEVEAARQRLKEAQRARP